MNSTTLCEVPSFFSGMASIFDFNSSLLQFNISDTPDDADEEALQHDVRMVAEDFYAAIHIYENESKMTA